MIEAVHLADEAERLRAAEPIEQREIFGHDADLPLDGDGIRDRIDVEDAKRPGRRPQQSGEALDRRRLAGAVRSEESVEAAARHEEIDPVHGDELAEFLAQAVSLDRGRAHLSVRIINPRRGARSRARTRAGRRRRTRRRPASGVLYRTHSPGCVTTA